MSDLATSTAFTPSISAANDTSTASSPADIIHRQAPTATGGTSGTTSKTWAKEELAEFFRKFGMGTYALSNVGVLVLMMNRDIQERKIDSDGNNRGVMALPIMVAPTGLLRQLAETPGELTAMSATESLSYAYLSAMMLVRVDGVDNLYSQEMGELTPMLANGLAEPLSYSAATRNVLANPVLTSEDDSTGTKMIRLIDGGIVFLGLLALPTNMQRTTNNMNNIVVCEEGVDPSVCQEIQDRAEDTEGDSTCEDLNLCDEESEEVAQEKTPGGSEISRLVTGFELEGKIFSLTDLFNRNLMGVQAFEIDGKPWLGLIVGALTIPLQYVVASEAGVNPDPYQEGIPLRGDNAGLPILAFVLGSAEAISTNDPEMMAFYSAHNALFATGIYAPEAMGLLDTVNLDDGNSEVAGMFNNILPGLNAVPAMRSGYWLVDQIKDWDELDVAERIGLVTMPVASWAVYTGSTIQASEMSSEVWQDYLIQWGAYLLGALASLGISNTKFGHAIDGINERFDPKNTTILERAGIYNLQLNAGPMNVPSHRGEDSMGVGVGVSFNF